MIANCDTPDIAMLRWIAFIRMINPELRHIVGKDNPIANMLSRARYEDSECRVEMHDVLGEQMHFREGLYSDDLLVIERYLSTLKKDPAWSRKTFEKIQKKSYGFLLRDGYLWRWSKKPNWVSLRAVGDVDTRSKVLQECHDMEVVGH
ncbi:unnamed protein product [Calypogeia fissa]